MLLVFINVNEPSGTAVISIATGAHLATGCIICCGGVGLGRLNVISAPALFTVLHTGQGKAFGETLLLTQFNCYLVIVKLKLLECR